LLLGTPPRLHRFATLLTRAPPAVRFASQPPVTGAVTLLRPSSRHAAPPTPFALGLASDGSRSFSPKKSRICQEAHVPRFGFPKGNALWPPEASLATHCQAGRPGNRLHAPTAFGHHKKWRQAHPPVSPGRPPVATATPRTPQAARGGESSV